MKIHFFLPLAFVSVLAAEDLPKPGKLLVSADFALPDATAKWRWGRGKWEVSDGILKGTERPEDHHIAGLACQQPHHDAVIRYRFQFAGGNQATLLLRNQFGNLCRVIVTPTGMTIQKDKPNLPAGNSGKTESLGKLPLKLEPQKWYDITVIVHGADFSAEISGEGKLSGSHPAIDVDKTEIEFMAGGDSVLFDDLKAESLQ